MKINLRTIYLFQTYYTSEWGGLPVIIGIVLFVVLCVAPA